MKISLSMLAIFLQLTYVHTKTSSQSQSKWSYMLDELMDKSILSSYTNHFANLKHTLTTTYQAINDIYSLYKHSNSHNNRTKDEQWDNLMDLFKEDDSDHFDAEEFQQRRILEQKVDQEEEEIVDSDCIGSEFSDSSDDENEPKPQGRQLFVRTWVDTFTNKVTNCHNGGVLVTINATLWKCEKGNYYAHPYMTIEKYRDQCKLTTKVMQVCECPKDFHGRFCQDSGYMMCDTEQISPQQKCGDHDASVASYRDVQDNLGKCQLYREGDQITFRFKTNCYQPNSDQSTPHFTIMTYLSPRPKFTYKFEKEKFKFSHDKRFQFLIYLENINSKYPNKIIEKFYSYMDIIDKGYFEFTLTIDKEVLQSESYGRIFYEYRPYYYWKTKFHVGVLDNADYQEPTIPIIKRIPWFVFVIITLICVPIIHLYKPKKAEKVHSSSSYEELQEDSDITTYSEASTRATVSRSTSNNSS